MCGVSIRSLLLCLWLLVLASPLMCVIDVEEFRNQFNARFDDELYDFDIEDGPWSVLPYGYAYRNMDTLCKHTDICSTKLGYKVDTSEPPCCMGCSCESDCGLTQNCCFPELELYELPGPDEDYSSCVFPVTQVYAENLPIHGYTMIDRCPLERACNPCGDHKVAEWGSLHPVYSNETGLIYKNQKCAQCYNITDGIIWEPFQIVNMKEDLSSLPTRGHHLTSELGDKNNMVVRFMPPEGVNLNRHACFENIIDSCKHDYQYHFFGNLSDHQICQTGLYAPHFYNGQYYANIFCTFCIMDSRAMRKEGRKCTPQSVEPAGDFLAAIDFELTFKNGVSETIEACSSRGKKCKDVLCPIGHIRYNDECVLAYSKWFHKNIQLVLEFNPKTENDRVTAYRLEDIQVSLSTPLTKWLQKRIIIEQGDSSSILRVYAEMMWNQTSSDHVITAEIIQDTYSLVQQSKCNIQYITSSFIYDASISRYAFFDENKHQPLWRTMKESSNLQGGPGSFETLTDMTTMYYNKGVRSGDGVPVSINKLFFCEQVELKHREFVTYFNNTQLYQKETGNLYHDGEFLLINKQDGKQVAKVCLENSGYHVVKLRSRSSKTSFRLEMLFISLGIFALKQNKL